MASTQTERIRFDESNIELQASGENRDEQNLETKHKVNKNKLILFCAIFVFKTLGMFNYICDVGSDILNAFDYLRTQKEWPKIADNSDYNYTRELCDDWQSYRHVKMGTLTLAIVFLPSTLGILFLGRYMIDSYLTLDSFNSRN